MGFRIGEALINIDQRNSAEDCIERAGKDQKFYILFSAGFNNVFCSFKIY